MTLCDALMLLRLVASIIYNERYNKVHEDANRYILYLNIVQFIGVNKNIYLTLDIDRNFMIYENSSNVNMSNKSIYTYIQ